MTTADIVRLRLQAQLLDRHPLSTPVEVVRWLGAVQAQDYLGSLWAVGLRLPGTTEAEVERAIADREIVRTWPMRGTIHYVAAEDARWMLELLTPRVIARSAGRYRQLELGEKVFARSRDVLTKALEGGQALTRKALYGALEAANIPTTDARGLHILGHLAQEGLVCFGPRAGKQPTFVLLDEWVPATMPLAHDEAVAELARRYFGSHGPATVQDFVWWSGLTVAEARLGTDLAAADLSRVTVAETTYWFVDGPWTRTEPVAAHLLPFFDEFLVAYKDRSAALEPAHLARVNAGGGLLDPTVLLGGRVVGTWKRTLGKDGALLTLDPFAPLDEAQMQAVGETTGRYGAFLGVEARVQG